MKKLLVYYAGWGERWLWGTLAHNDEDILFVYSSDALEQGLELSPYRLKLSPQAYRDFPDYQFRLPGVIADSLPDGWGLLLMDRLFRQIRKDPAEVSPLDRLAFIADRGMSAFVFEPADFAALDQTDLDLLALATRTQGVLSGHDNDALRQLALLGGSPQGARPKVLAFRHEQSQTWHSQPVIGSDAWIVKFQAQNEHKEVCALECLYAQLARACGLEMPDTRHFDLDRNLAAFAARRFDQIDGLRVPVHSLAGVLHANFRLPSAVNYTSFLRTTALLTGDEREVKKAFERAVFNVLFNNRDDHGKNFSFQLGRDRRWRLAPCYDLTFSADRGAEHQLDVCGKGRDIARADMLRLALQGGLDAAVSETVIDRMIDCVGDFGRLARDWDIRKGTLAAVERSIADNRRWLR